MKLRFTPEAVRELRDILAYIENHSASGARNVNRRIEETLDQLLVHPYSGKRVAFGGMRRATTAPYPYFIFYLVEDEDLIVIGIRHAARSPSSMPGQQL
jgi:toxin ParE1/3/4